MVALTLGLCTYSIFPLPSTGDKIFRIPPPNVYILYNEPTSDFVEGEGHDMGLSGQLG